MKNLPLVMVVAVVAALAGWHLNDIVKGPSPKSTSESAAAESVNTTPATAAVPVRIADQTPNVTPRQSLVVTAVAQSAMEQINALYEALYAADGEAEAAIKAQLYQLIRQYSSDLAAQERWSDLLALRQRLVVLDPNTAEHHYQLAEVQVQLRLYEQALYSLYFILQDAVMGSKAQALEQRIKTKLRFAQGITVPLAKEGVHHVVEASLRNGTVRLLLDTGASITTLTPSAARRLNISYDQSRSITVATAGGLVAAPLIEITEFAVGEAAVDRLQVGILPLSDLDRFDGLLGMNFLQQFASSIDQQQGLLHLDEKS